MPSMPEFTNHLLQSRKYRALHLPPETIQDLIEQESSRYSTPREIQESVRKKLHHPHFHARTAALSRGVLPIHFQINRQTKSHPGPGLRAASLCHACYGIGTRDGLSSL